MSTSRRDRDLRKFIYTLRRLKGKPFFDGGSGWASMLSLNFGRKIRVVTGPPLKPVKLTVGEYKIWVQGASWRLTDPKGLMTSNFFENVERTNRNFRKAATSTVYSVRLNKSNFDLSLIFGNGYRLDLFCNTTNEFDAPNYSLFHNDDVFSIGPNSVFGYSLIKLPVKKNK